MVDRIHIREARGTSAVRDAVHAGYKVFGDVMTSSPELILAARHAMCRAAVPLDTATVGVLPRRSTPPWPPKRGTLPLRKPVGAQHVDDGVYVGLDDVVAAVGQVVEAHTFQSSCGDRRPRASSRSCCLRSGSFLDRLAASHHVALI